MQTHPSLIERVVCATLSAYSSKRITSEEAELDLVDLLATQIEGKTDYAMAVMGYYVRALLKAFSGGEIALADAFDAFVDAAAEGVNGHMPASLRLSQPLTEIRRLAV